MKTSILDKLLNRQQRLLNEINAERRMNGSVRPVILEEYDRLSAFIMEVYAEVKRALEASES